MCCMTKYASSLTCHALTKRGSCAPKRTVVLACQVGEVGELAELFQWRSDSAHNGLTGFSSEDKRRVGEEMSDVSFSVCVSIR